MTYENEVRILSSLQRLKHPNIQQLLGSYTYKSKHNLISPYIAGGSLRKYLEQAKSPNLCREEMLCSIAGLASAIWALHEFTLEGGELSNKGTHQDLRPDNILVDGNRFILADFGLSSIKSMDENTKTPFKGRTGYCQAPECAELGRPYHENETDRATDIFALACIMTDLVIYLVNGPSGIQRFRDARGFQITPMCYYLFHKGGSSHEAVAEWLVDVAAKDGSQSIQEAVELISEMLKINPTDRPTAAKVTARLYMCIIRAFSEQFSVLFASFSSSVDAIIEQARFSSWVLSQDVELYSSSLGATATGKNFDSTIDVLRELKRELENTDKYAADRDCRAFLGVRTLNTQLLSMLSPERRASSRSSLESILISYIEPDMPSAMYNAMRSAFGDYWVTLKAKTKQLVAQVEDPKTPSEIPSFHVISGPIKYAQRERCCTTAKVQSDEHSRSIPVIVEKIKYQDQFRAQKLLPRIHALCDLLSSKNLGHQLRVPPFYALYDHVEKFRFEILYEFPTEYGRELSPVNPISLHELLTEQAISSFPSWESRFKLGLELTDSLAAFHDVHWFHKDLTSFSVLFFPTKGTAPPARAKRPYLTGFQHSRSATDDFSEGPLQDPKHQRYHHPKYVCVENHQFFRFRPQFDYYSLGILLLEIGFWATIEAIMHDYTNEDNYAFSEAIIKLKLPELSFHMGTGYADIVRECLIGFDEQPHNMDTSPSSDLTVNVLFRRKVAMQLKTLGRYDFSERSVGKRKRDEEDNVETPLASKLKLTTSAG